MSEQIAKGTFAQGLIRVGDAAGWLGISRSAVYRLLDEGKIRSIRIGTARLIPREEVAGFARRMLEVEGNHDA